MSGYVFVDETKSRGYLLVACQIHPSDQDAVRKVVRDLVLPGQRRLHMNNEREPRKRAIAAAVVAADVRATVYDAGRRYRTERDRRAACLEALVLDAAGRRDRLLVLEQDDSLVRWDNQHLVDFTRRAGCSDTLAYEHRRPAADLLLGVPDAVAWCWARGGDWRRRVEPVVAEVRAV